MSMDIKKEVAKMFFGISIWEFLIHCYLHVSGLLPMQIPFPPLLINYTMNAFIIVFWAVIACVLGWYAWVARAR
jgi:hypothetical protein